MSPPRFFSPRQRELPSARVMLVQGTSPWARAVQERYGTPYSHAAFSIGDWAYECGVGGVVSVRMVCYGYKYDLFGIDGMDEYTSAQLHVWCRNTMRCSYDYLSLVRFFRDVLVSLIDGKSMDSVPALYYAGAYIAAGMAYLGLDLTRDPAKMRADMLEREPRLFMIEQGVR